MIKGLFRSPEDLRILGELQSFSQFRHCVDKLRTARDKADVDLRYASQDKVLTQQGYSRALAELVEELTKTVP